MIPLSRRIIKACALTVIFSLLHVYLVTTVSASIMPQAITARLTTRGNQSITVNGNPATGGATVLTGSTVETGDQVSATLNLGAMGSIDIAPNTKLKVEFSNGQIKVTVSEGCLIVRVKEGTYGEIYTAQGKAASNDAIKREAATLDVCNPPGAPSPIVNQGAAANAGAGVPETAGGAGGGGVSGALVATLVVGGVALGIGAFALGNRGDNPSGSS